MGPLLILFLAVLCIAEEKVVPSTDGESRLDYGMVELLKEMNPDYVPTSGDDIYSNDPTKNPLLKVLLIFRSKAMENKDFNLSMIKALPDLVETILSPGDQPLIDDVTIYKPRQMKVLHPSTTDDPQQTSTEVPFTEYVTDLVKHQPPTTPSSPELLSEDGTMQQEYSTEGPNQETSTNTMDTEDLKNADRIWYRQFFTRSGYTLDNANTPNEESYVMGASPELSSISKDLDIEKNYYKIHSYKSLPEFQSLDDFISQFENSDGPLSEDSRLELIRVFADFQAHFDNSDSTFVESLERVVDQRDIEISLLNVRENLIPSTIEEKRAIVAFTLSGVPLKLYIDRQIANPIEYLNEVLFKAGLSLNIPVISGTYQPVGDEMLYVGAGSGALPSPAIALRVLDVENIAKRVKTFLKQSYASTLGVHAQTRILTAALQEALSSGRSFAELLQEKFKEDPILVTSDISDFLRHSHER